MTALPGGSGQATSVRAPLSPESSDLGNSAAALAPIFIMSFDRPHYLRQVLKSLKGQVGCQIERRRIVLFQDGAVNPFSGKRHATDDQIAACVKIFRDTFPTQPVMVSPINLGVALNFDRAERVAFEHLVAPAAIFLEDDLVLNPHYIATLDTLLQQFLHDERVGYVAAYGDHRLSLDQQTANSSTLISMYHNWGFALYRRQWRRMRHRVLQYLRLLDKVDYRDRDRIAIRKLFASWGFGCPAASQDAAKTIACLADDAIKLNTYACNAHYIGEQGLHMTEELFVKRGYDKTSVFDKRVMTFKPLDTGTYKRCLREQRHWAGLPAEVAVQKQNPPLPLKAPRIGPEGKLQPVSKPMSATRLAKEILGSDVLQEYRAEYPEDLQGWNSVHPVFRELISTGSVRVIFDVGVWKGGSTITFAKLLREFGIDGSIIAIDTFLGSPEHWNRNRPDKIFESLRLEYGYPRLYRQFLSNLKHQGCEQYVVPLPQTTENAAKILAARGVAADLIHLDAAHEYEPVLRDAVDYWKLLKPGGVMIGDDYHPTWPGVVRAADEFAKRVGAALEIRQPKWIARKGA
jgi:predicted O-methyltransferase YrrM